MLDREKYAFTGHIYFLESFWAETIVIDHCLMLVVSSFKDLVLYYIYMHEHITYERHNALGPNQASVFLFSGKQVYGKYVDKTSEAYCWNINICQKGNMLLAKAQPQYTIGPKFSTVAEKLTYSSWTSKMPLPHFFMSFWNENLLGFISVVKF